MTTIKFTHEKDSQNIKPSKQQMDHEKQRLSQFMNQCNDINQSKRISYQIVVPIINMNKPLLLVLVFCLSLTSQSDLYPQIEPHQQDLSNKPLVEDIAKNSVKLIKIEPNKVEKYQFVAGQLYVVFAKYDLQKRVNINLYSSQILFGFLYKQFQISAKDSFSGNDSITIQSQFLSRKAATFGRLISDDHELTDKITQNQQYKHFLSLETLSKKPNSPLQENSKYGVVMIAIKIPLEHQKDKEQVSAHQKFTVNIIVTTNTTVIKKQAFQKHVQYKLLKDQSHQFYVDIAGVFKDTKNDKKTSDNLSKGMLSEDIDEFFLFHNIHVVGEFSYNVSILIKQSGSQEPESLNLVNLNCSQSTYQFNSSLLHQQFKSKPLILSSEDYKAKSTKAYTKETYVFFQVRCTSPVCVLIAEVENNVQMRNVVLGIPYIYSINSFQIFQIHNPFDLDIFIDMNKKNGFPQYQICSQRPSSIPSSPYSKNCIQQLINPSMGVHMFEVKQKDDKLHALGRNNQIIINPAHQAYCYQCTYYLGLYTDYDTVEGMINFKNERTSVILPQGNFVTKVLRRNFTDVYEMYGLDSRILFERFSGRYDVYFQLIDLEQNHALYNRHKGETRQKRRIKLKKKDSQYSIDLKQEIEQIQDLINERQGLKSKPNELMLQPKEGSQNLVYRVTITTENNYPSTYYSMMVVNNQSHNIMLKDGIPFFNKQTNKVSVFKYLTENLQTQSFGTIIINSNQISQIQLQIYGDCLTLEQTLDSVKKYKIEKEDSSTLNTLKNRMKLSVSNKQKKYELQQISNKKINFMANRIDIIIEPEMCKSYTIKMINNPTNTTTPNQSTFISYRILVSFIDSIILPLNNEVPGILQYPGKIIQIYEVFVPEKCTLSVLINFCRSAKSRMEIYRNKEALFIQNSDQKVLFTSESQLEEIIYQAHSELFYITIEFFGFSSILEYTLLVKKHQVEEGFYYIDLSQDEKDIQYVVQDGRFFSTTYKLFFSPVFLKHWSKDVQRDVEQFQTKYFILQSNSYPLLKRASNCKGQFFSDIVNHHQHFRQINLDKEKLTFHPPNKDLNEFRHQSEYSRGYYSFEYQTNNPLSFVIIVPVVSKSTLGHEMSVIPYWELDKKSRQPYKITQLYNGKIYSIFEHWLISIVIWMEEVVDFHVYQGLIIMLVGICSCLPITCCLMICIYRTKVNIEYYCDLLYSRIENIVRRNSQGQNIRQVRDSEQINLQESVAIPSQENDSFTGHNVEVPEDSQDENQMHSQSYNQIECEQQQIRAVQIIQQNDDNIQFLDSSLNDRLPP